MYEKTKLKNNLTVVSHRMSEAFSVSIGVWLKVGSRYEDSPVSGISHFLEHMVFKGSKKYSGKAIKRQIEGSGGLLNGFTSEELTCYLAKVPRKTAHSTLKILLNMALEPVLKQTDITRERTVIIEEIKMYKDLPQHMVQDLLDKSMWPNHPLGRNIAGTPESVSSITRDNLVKYKESYYRPGNMVIVFAGDIRHKDCLDFIRDSLDSADAVGQGSLFDKFRTQQKQPSINTSVKDIKQTHLAIGFPAFKRTHPKRFALTLLSTILGGNMSSRLFDKIREKRGLAYAISSQYKKLTDTGAFYIHAGLDSSKTDLTLELVLEELNEFKKNLASEQELKRAKEFCLGHLAMSLEDTLEHMLFLGEAVSAVGEIKNFDQIKKEVQKVGLSDIREVAKDIFKKDKINISLVGPIKDFKSEKCLDRINDHLG